MPFYVYGKNAVTGEIARRLYCAVPTREEARQQAESQGLEVSEIIACDPAAATPGVERRVPPTGTPVRATAAAIGQFRRELDYATPYSLATYALIAANVLVFAMMCMSGVSPKDPTVNGLLGWGADFGPKSLGGQWWRLFTSLFVHIGFLHLLYNMLALVPAGRNLERLVGSLNFLLIYVVAGLGGSLWALYWSPLILSAGASGAVFGVYGALGAVVLVRARAMPPELVASLKKSVIAFVLYNAVYSLRPGISLAAHAGGLVVGFACGILVARPGPSDEAEPIGDRSAAALALGAILLLAGLFGLHLRYPDLPRLQDAFARFDALDMKASRIVADAAAKFDRKDLSGDQFEQILNRDVLPDWNTVRDQLVGYRPVPHGLQDEVGAIAAYMQLRADGWKLLIEAVRDGGKDKLDTAGRKMREANLAERGLFRGVRTRVFPDRV